jgi:hypothetical protein
MTSLKHRLMAPLAAVALLISGAAVLLAGPAASAATSLQILATTTSVSATPSVVVAASLDDPSFTPQSTTLTATVTEAPLGGLVVTPTGKVTFRATDAHGASIALGSKNVGLCLLTLVKCTASLSTNGFRVDPLDATAGGTTWTVTASYPGDTLAKPSMGTTEVTAATGDTSTCETNASCYVSSTNGDDSAFVSLSIDCVSHCITTSVRQESAAPTINAAAGPPPTMYSISTGFGFPSMSSCPGGNSALDPSGVSQNADMWFPSSVVSAARPADITYELIGSTADAQAALPDPTSFCYAQTGEFTQANGTPAPFDAATGQFEGNPPACTAAVFPCKHDESYVAGEPSTWEIQVEALIDPGAGKH